MKKKVIIIILAIVLLIVTAIISIYTLAGLTKLFAEGKFKISPDTETKILALGSKYGIWLFWAIIFLFYLILFSVIIFLITWIRRKKEKKYNNIIMPGTVEKQSSLKYKIILIIILIIIFGLSIWYWQNDKSRFSCYQVKGLKEYNLEDYKKYESFFTNSLMYEIKYPQDWYLHENFQFPEAGGLIDITPVSENEYSEDIQCPVLTIGIDGPYVFEPIKSGLVINIDDLSQESAKSAGEEQTEMADEEEHLQWFANEIISKNKKIIPGLEIEIKKSSSLGLKSIIGELYVKHKNEIIARGSVNFLQYKYYNSDYMEIYYITIFYTYPEVQKITYKSIFENIANSFKISLGIEDLDYMNSAIVNRDLTICNKIENPLIKVSCYHTHLIREIVEYPAACDKIEEQDYKDLCYKDVAREIKDFTLCERIRGSLIKNECYRYAD